MLKSGGRREDVVSLIEEDDHDDGLALEVAVAACRKLSFPSSLSSLDAHFKVSGFDIAPPILNVRSRCSRCPSFATASSCIPVSIRWIRSANVGPLEVDGTAPLDDVGRDERTGPMGGSLEMDKADGWLNRKRSSSSDEVSI